MNDMESIQIRIPPSLLGWIDEQAENRMEELIESLNEKYPAPNKETEQMAWVAHQNNLTAMAEEIVLKELVYN